MAKVAGMAKIRKLASRAPLIIIQSTSNCHPERKRRICVEELSWQIPPESEWQSIRNDKSSRNGKNQKTGIQSATNHHPEYLQLSSRAEAKDLRRRIILTDSSGVGMTKYSEWHR